MSTSNDGDQDDNLQPAPDELVYGATEITPQLEQVFRGLANLSTTVPIEKWCLIGGLMVDVLLRQRGRTHLRPTEDGDVVGDVAADRRILRTISLALRDQGFEIEETGLRFDFGVRHCKEEGVYIDLLAPANSARLKNIWQPKAGLKALAAPGSDSAMATAIPITIRVGTPSDALTIRVPTLAGAIHLKVSAWSELASNTDRDRHIHDAAQLLAAAQLEDLDIRTSGMPAKATQKRLAILADALQDERSPNWGLVDMAERRPSLVRLARVLG